MNKFITIILLSAGLISSFSCTSVHETSLKEAYKDSFMIGCAVNPSHTSGGLVPANELILKHFNAISPENCLKAYIFTDWKVWITLHDIVEASGFFVRSMIVWDKGFEAMGYGWRTAHELCMCGLSESAPPFAS